MENKKNSYNYKSKGENLLIIISFYFFGLILIFLKDNISSLNMN